MQPETAQSLDAVAGRGFGRYNLGKVKAMKTIAVELPDDAFGALRLDPESFAREIRIAAAIHWYQQGKISQGRAAELAGLPRADFIDELGRRQIEAISGDVEDLERELALG